MTKVGVALVLIVLISLVTTVMMRTLSVRPVVLPEVMEVDLLTRDEAWIHRLRGVLKFSTVAWGPNNVSEWEILKMISFIQNAFPLVHTSPYVKRERVANLSLLYRVVGSNRELPPYLLMAHLDVVPANPEKWEHPPFSGNLESGYVYGRGALDDKSAAMAILEGLEGLLLRGHQPVRSFVIAFGHDEEISGENGARYLAARLNELGMKRFNFILDEGLYMTSNLLRGVDVPVAGIGVTEKGQLIFQLSVKGHSGHSSLPPPETPIGILSGALHRLETYQRPAHLSGPVADAFWNIAPYSTYPYRIIYSNLWLFASFMSSTMSKNPMTNSLLRTTTAITQINAGIKANVLPDEAVAIVNQRIIPGETTDEVLKYNAAIMNDPRVTVKVIERMESPPLSPYGEDVSGFREISESLHQVFRNVAVVPSILVANTDTKHYLAFSDKIYRFRPFTLTLDDFKRVHGDNERISIENYYQVVNFYYRLMVNCEAMSLPTTVEDGL